MPKVLAWPVRANPDGSLVTVEYGSPDHARQAVELIATTIRGERVADPAFGVLETVGEITYDAESLRAEVAERAPYARLVSVDGYRETGDRLAFNVESAVSRSA